MKSLATLRRIGRSAGKNFDEIPIKFFTDLTNAMYPKNKHRREWALSNLELFYNSKRDEINILNELRKEHG